MLCNSTYTESLVKPRARKTWLVPNAVRREFFEVPLPALATAAKPVLLNIGVIAPHKRQLALLELAEHLHREGYSFEFQFIGAADPLNKYAATFLERIKAAERNGFARYLGTKSLPELIKSLDASSALVHVPFEEAFGLVVAEALARNLKFFGTNIGGLTDVANGVEGAELFQLKDQQLLRTGIANWLRAGCPRPATSAAEMKKRYHPDVIAKRHAEIYREILQPSRG